MLNKQNEIYFNFTKILYFFLIFVNFNLPKNLCFEIKLKEGNNSFIVYENNTLNELFYYHKDYDICDCSPIMNYFENSNINVTNFEINLDKTIDNFKIEKIIVKSDNPYIITNFTLNQTKFNTNILKIEHFCEMPEYYDKYWGVIKIEIYKSLVTMDKIKFNMIKFCQPPELMGSILTVTILFIMSTIILIISTYSEISIELTEIPNEGEIKQWHGLILITLGSLILILIFYFIEYINIVFTILITFQIGLASYLCLKTFYEFLNLNQHKKFLIFNKKIKVFKNHFELEIYSLMILIITSILLIIYLITRHWVLNNIFGFFLVFTILSLFHINSFRICGIILLSAFFYDVFWVYISPLFFNKNVMVVAATSINLPIKFEMPILFDSHPLKSCMFLGLGDLVIPGLVLKFCHRFDFIKNTKIYYISSIFLYIFALILSGIVVAVFNYPQPVLFYMCPVLLIGLGLISYKNNSFYDMWNANLLEENLQINFDCKDTIDDKIEINCDISLNDSYLSDYSNSSSSDDKF